MKLPSGFETINKVLLPQQLVYGLRQSPLNFYEHLHQGLESRNFIKPDHDDCLFTNVEVIILVWVNYCMFYANVTKKIDQFNFFKDLFLLEKENDMAGILGLSIKIDTKGETITLTQQGLAEQILKTIWI